LKIFSIPVLQSRTRIILVDAEPPREPVPALNFMFIIITDDFDYFLKHYLYLLVSYYSHSHLQLFFMFTFEIKNFPKLNLAIKYSTVLYCTAVQLQYSRSWSSAVSKRCVLQQ
jgi:hypothetical protein